MLWKKYQKNIKKKNIKKYIYKKKKKETVILYCYEKIYKRI